MLPYYDQLKIWALKDDMRGFDCLGAEDWFPAPTLAAVRGGVATIKRGHKGESVEYVQALSGAIADSKFGKDTEDAVKAFQKSRGLPVTGVVDFSTLTMLDVLAGGTAGISKPSAPVPSKPPEMVFEPDVIALKSKPTVALVKTESAPGTSWWTDPAWKGTTAKRWHVAAAGAGGVIGLGALFALLSGGSGEMK